MSINIDLVTVSATNLCYGGLPITNATINFQPVSTSGQPIPLRFGGTSGGQNAGAFSALVNEGTFSIQLPDTTQTTPQNLAYSVTVTDNLTGKSLLGEGYGLYQPPTHTLNFDLFGPNLPAQVTVQQGPSGTVQIGQVVSTSTTAAVSNSGTAQNAVLNFALPKGDKGDPGTITANSTNGDFGVALALRAKNSITLEKPDIDVTAAPYGAIGDGIHDDTDAFISAFQAMATKRQPGGGMLSLYIPAGNYKVTSGDWLKGITGSVTGAKIHGAGRGGTIITLTPPNSTTTRSYLFGNNTSWLHMEFSDISFVGDCQNSAGNTGYTQTSFFSSYSTGTGQNYTFRNVNISNFDRAIDLTGNNCNSEMQFLHCGFYGYVNHGLYVDPSVGQGGDQFLNYNFYDCQFEVGDGAFIDVAYGGSINVHGGSFIHTASNAVAPFFNLGVGAGAHAFGTQRLLVTGVRFEHRGGTSKLINCEWQGGNVTFIGCDDSAEAYQTGSQSWVTSRFSFGNSGGPVILFEACNLMGQHKYVGSVNQFNAAHTVTYRECDIFGHISPADFLIDDTSAGNIGGFPIRRFEKVRFFGSSLVGGIAPLYTSDYGWHSALAAVTSEKVMVFKGVDGALPGNQATTTIELPLNALITEITFWSPFGAVTDGNNVNFTVHTNESASGTATLVAGNNYFVLDAAIPHLGLGQTVTGAGIPAGAIVTYINGAGVSISGNLTASATASPVTFGPTQLAVLDTSATTGAAANGFFQSSPPSEKGVGTPPGRYLCSTDGKRALFLQNNVAGSQYNGGGQVYVRYVG